MFTLVVIRITKDSKCCDQKPCSESYALLSQHSDICSKKEHSATKAVNKVKEALRSDFVLEDNDDNVNTPLLDPDYRADPMTLLVW